jgi:hypothetical protein
MTMIGMHTVTLLLIVFCQTFTFSPGRSGIKHSIVSQTTAISAQWQPDSPLQISAVTNRSPDPQKLDITFAVANTANKAIRAYAIKHEVGCCGSNGSQMRGSSLSNILSVDKLFLPGQVRSEEIGNEWSGSPYEKVTLSIDFVEFTDGSTWGPDISKSRERLEGMREGIKAAKTVLLKLFSEKGSQAAVELIESDMNLLPPEQNHSQAWVTGFQTGVKSMSARLLHAYQDKGIAGIEKGLKQPFDASEEK